MKIDKEPAIELPPPIRLLNPRLNGFGLDLTYAGRNVKSRQMVLPKVNTTERDAFEANTVGAIIYNTQLQKIQVYTGSSWETVSSS